MNMRYYIMTLLIMLVHSSTVRAQTAQIDSLQNLLERTTNAQQRTDLLINLRDLCESTDKESLYAFRLFDEAKKAKDLLGITSSLGTITSHFLETMNKDSLFYYLNEAETMVKGSEHDGLPTYYKMTYYARLIQTADRENRAAICEKTIQELGEHKDKENHYQQAKRLFLTGIANFQLMTLAEKIDWNIGLAYWEQAWDLAQEFPLAARKNFSANLCICLINSYLQSKENQKLLNVANSYLNTLDQYFDQKEIKNRRPFIYKDLAYTVCYQQLIRSDDVIGKESAHTYYLRYADFMKTGKGDALLRNSSFFYDISFQHYLKRKEYNKALAFKDSLIELIENKKSLTSVNTYHYKDKASLLFKMGKYKDSSLSYNKALMASDSLTEKEYLDKISEMQVKFQVDKLELDNANLLAEKRKNALYFVVTVTMIIALISLYLYLNLKKVRRLQKDLVAESAKACESENMKTAFINSMCHEIRTPLNAICGFAEIVLDDTIDKEEREQYPQIIRTNTKILTSLLNDLLETANLDSSTNSFLVEAVDVKSLCMNEMSYLQETAKKPNIQYILELPESDCIFNTHPKYFSLLIRSLLDNANKFTEAGSITLSCHPDPLHREIVFSVTDTGCGIPINKHQFVFERFSKVDSFSQGSGLGLYISQIIVKRMNGHIRIDPQYTGGTKFIFSIPNS